MKYWLAKNARRVDPHHEADLDILNADTVHDQHVINQPAARLWCVTYPGPQSKPGVNSNKFEPLQEPLLQDQLAVTEFGTRYTVYIYICTYIYHILYIIYTYVYIYIYTVVKFYSYAATLLLARYSINLTLNNFGILVALLQARW